MDERSAGNTSPASQDAALDLTLNRRGFLSTAAGLGVTGLGVTGLGAVAVPRVLPASSAASRGSVTYTFADEFDGPAGSAPDPSKWTYDLGGGGWGNNELEVYTSSRANSFLDGQSHLVIRATQTVDTSSGQAVTTYNSARLKTQGLFSQYQGTFEARIKLSISQGAWPAWWMKGANQPQVGWPECGEVDMLENYGKSASVETTVHTPNNAGTGTYAAYADIPADDGWHIWRAVWSAAAFSFYQDGSRYLTVRPSQLPNWCYSSGVPMFMLLNLAIGGNPTGTPPPATQFPLDMLVDYVHVW